MQWIVRIYKAVLLAGALLLASGYAKASVVIIDNPSFRFNVAPYTEYARDPYAKVPVDELLQPSPLLQFHPLGSDAIHFGYISDRLWIKFETLNTLTTKVDIAIEVNYSLLNAIHLYETDNDKIINTYKLGISYDNIQDKIESYTVKSRNNIFLLTLPAGTHRTFYISVDTISSMVVPLHISSLDKLYESSVHDEFLYAIYYGMIIGFILYSLGIYSITRKHINLIHAYINLGFLCFNLAVDGYFRLWFPYLGQLNVTSTYFFMSIVASFTMHFTTIYFDMSTQPFLKRRLELYSNLAILVAFLIFILPPSIVPIMGISVVVATGIILVYIGIYFIKINKESALIFTVCWIPISILITMAAAGSLAIIDIGNYDLIVIKISMAWVSILLAVAMGFTVNQLNHDLESEVLQRNEANKRLELLNKDLDDRVTSRTYELNHTNKVLMITLDELKKAQTELLESNKMAALGQFVSGVTYEITTPIGIILTAVSYLANECRETLNMVQSNTIKRSQLIDKLSNMSESIRLIENSTKRTNELISAFKEFSQENYEFTPERVHLNSFLGDALNSYSNQIQALQVNTVVDCPLHIELITSPQQLGKMLRYLIHNALEHAFKHDQSNKEIQIRVSEQQRDIQIVFGDNGIGIPETNRDYIFNPFFTTKRAEGFKGLGLTVVYNIVTHILKGTITLQHQKGTTFVIRLPKAPE